MRSGVQVAHVDSLGDAPENHHSPAGPHHAGSLSASRQKFACQAGLQELARTCERPAFGREGTVKAARQQQQQQEQCGESSSASRMTHLILTVQSAATFSLAETQQRPNAQLLDLRVALFAWSRSHLAEMLSLQPPRWTRCSGSKSTITCKDSPSSLHPPSDDDDVVAPRCASVQSSVRRGCPEAKTYRMQLTKIVSNFEQIGEQFHVRSVLVIVSTPRPDSHVPQDSRRRFSPSTKPV